MADTQKNPALPTKEEVLNNEDALLRGLIEAQSFKEDESLRRKIEIRKNGNVLFSFTVRPIDEEEEMACLKRATPQLRNPNGRHLPKIDGKTDSSLFRSMKIYTATIDEDKARIWDNPKMKNALDAMTAVEMIDKVLRSGDKDAIINVINEISGSTLDNDRIGTDGEQAEEPTLEEYVKN